MAYKAAIYVTTPVVNDLRYTPGTGWVVLKDTRAIRQLATGNSAFPAGTWDLRSGHPMIFKLANRIAVVGYSPFGQRNFPKPASRQGRVPAEIGNRRGKTPRQVALRFLTRRPNLFTIPKSADPDHVRENAGGSGWKLTTDDLAQIDSVFSPPVRAEPLDML